MKIKSLAVFAVIATLLTSCMEWESSVLEDTVSVSQSTASIPALNSAPAPESKTAGAI